ncbi:MAG: FtsX-like permease family protein [Firmicutes bacterium]|nr:FtsX-like permease family protein [Bacillota bacterium]
MVKAWTKNNLREITHTLGRYLAIVGIVALGVGFFAGVKTAKPAMLQTGAHYVEQTRMFDYRLISTLGMTQADAEYFAALPEVECAEGSNSVDLLARMGEKELALKAMSISGEVNLVSLTAGRMPAQADECLADARRFSEADIGKTLTVTETSTEDALTVSEFTVVGLCNSPLYLNTERGTTKLGGGTLNAFVCAPKEAFSADYYTEIYLRLTDTDRALYSDAYDVRIEAAQDGLQTALDERVELRYQDIVAQAREQLAEAQAEYDKGAAEYASERENAEAELAAAKQELDDAEAQLASSRYRLSEGERQLEEGRQAFEDGKAAYEQGLSELEAQKTEAYAQLDAAQAEIDENRAKLDAAQAEIDESGVLVQYEALLVTQRQLEERLAGLEPNSAEYFACKGLLDTANLLIEQIQNSDFYAQYQELVAARAQLDAGQAELDAKRAEADSGFAAAQAELDAAKRQLDESEAQLAASEQEIRNGWAAVYAGEAELEEGRAAYDEAYAQAQEGFAEAEKELAESKRALEDAEVEVEKIEHPSCYLLDRDTNTGYVSFRSDSDIVEGVARVLPLFFFLVAAFVCITTMTRMLDEHRTQIGTLKALGYSDGRIAWKYISYSGSAALIGCVIGFLVGTWLFPMVIWEGYSLLYNFAALEYIFDWKMALVSLAASMVCSVGTTWLTCRSELRRLPAVLMRPRAPKAGKRILLEHIPILWNRFSFLYKVSIRNIMRYKKRLFMMLLGIGGCTALIATGFGIRDSIANIADDQFTDIMHYDISLSFSVPMTEQRQARFAEDFPDVECVFTATSAYEARANGAVVSVNTIATDDPRITDAVTLQYNGELVPYPENGVVIDEALADLLGLKVGDKLPLSVDATTTVEAEIVGLHENRVYHYAYMTAETYEALFGEPCSYESAFVMTDGDPYALGAELTKNSTVSSVSVTQSMRDQVGNMMKSLDYIVVVVILAACALAFIVLYNLSNISITERVREIATVKVLGFYPRETQSYVFREILLLTVAGALVGLPCGKLLHGYVMEQIAVDMVSFEVRIAPLSYGLAFGITIVLALLVNLLLLRKLDRIDMAESLKSVE